MTQTGRLELGSEEDLELSTRGQKYITRLDVPDVRKELTILFHSFARGDSDYNGLFQRVGYEIINVLVRKVKSGEGTASQDQKQKNTRMGVLKRMECTPSR